jgi:hypothetical protein
MTTPSRKACSQLISYDHLCDYFGCDRDHDSLACLASTPLRAIAAQLLAA